MFVYDEITGRAYENPPHSGRLVPRPPGAVAPCRIAGVGCAKGTPEKQRGLNPANLAAYRHYRECRATGRFPDDAIVRRNAAIIRAQEESHEREAWADFRNSLLARLR